MNENLLKVVDALINDDETMASEYLRQAMVEKMRDRMGINESVLVFGYAKMHQNKSKNINIISNEIIIVSIQKTRLPKLLRAGKLRKTATNVVLTKLKSFEKSLGMNC